MGDEDPRRRCDGDFGACRNASHRSRALRLARASESWQRALFLGGFGILTVTGYGLYYAGGESLRAWTSWIHLAVGIGRCRYF
jgi:hypothetical protein